MDQMDAVLTELRGRAIQSASSSVLLVHGKDVLFSYQRHPGPFELLDTMSVTKSVVALCFGILCQRGLLDGVDCVLSNYFPSWRHGLYQTITLRHILNHTSGLYNDPSASDLYGASSMLDLALNAPLVSDPGCVFAYNNKSMAILAALVDILSGMPLDQFAQTHLFAPLGIDTYVWRKDPAGLPHALAGLRLTAPDLIKLGRFVLDGGCIDHAPLMGRDFYRDMLTPSPASKGRCGLLWWIDQKARHIAAQGFLGQWLLIYPDSGLIAVRQLAKETTTAETADFFHDFKTLTRQLSKILQPIPLPQDSPFSDGFPF